jgi:hypothetical protein
MRFVDAIPHDEDDAPRRKNRWRGSELGAAPRRRRKTSNSKWAPPLILGNGTIRIQSRVGYRALSMELKPGLWIIAELKDPDGESFGGTNDVQAVAKTALTTVDQALDTIFPNRAAQKRQAAEAARDRKEARRLRRQLERQRAEQRALPAPQQQRLLPAPSPVSRSNARWAPDDDDFDDDEE